MRRERTAPGASRPGLAGAAVALAALAPLAPAGPAAAQQAAEVRLEARPVSDAQRRLEDFLEAGGYRLWTRDTVLARGDSVTGDLLVLQSAARIEGRVSGHVFVVDGDLFLRPGARIGGDVLVIGGGFYGSGMAEVAGETTYRPNELLRAVPEAGGWTLFRVGPSLEALELGPLYGLRLPTAQRVDGWTLRWGGVARALALPWRPELEVELRFLPDRERLEGSVRHAWHPRDDLRFGIEGGRGTRTREDWIRPRLSNTVTFLLVEEDYRDYYRSDRAAAFVAGEPGEGPWRLSAAARWEEARSLDAEDRWSLFGNEGDEGDDPVRPNPAVDPGDAWSLLLSAGYERRQGRARLSARASLEGASREVAGDFDFLLGEFTGVLRRPLPWGHDLEGFLIARGDLGGSLPRQRWSSLGGVGSLPTFPLLGARGPRLLFGELTYAVPIPRLEVPAVGTTELFARAAAGSAWNEGETASFEQDLMAGLRFLFLELGFAVDPGRGETEVYLRSRLPRPTREGW